MRPIVTDRFQSQAFGLYQYVNHLTSLSVRLKCVVIVCDNGDGDLLIRFDVNVLIEAPPAALAAGVSSDEDDVEESLSDVESLSDCSISTFSLESSSTSAMCHFLARNNTVK